MAKDAQFISNYRQTVTTFLSILNNLEAMRHQWDALDYGNSLTGEDFAPPNDDIDLAKLTAAVSSAEAIGAFVQTGHASNLYAIVV